MDIAKVLEVSAENLEVEPALLWQFKPEVADKLNSDAINRMAGELGHGPIIEQLEVADPDPGVLNPNRFLRFTSTTGDQLTIHVWSVYGPTSLGGPRYLLDCKRAVAILRDWAAALKKAKPAKPYKPRRGSEAERIHKQLLKGKSHEQVQEITGASAANVRKVAERVRKARET
jgi:hypothetical protein